MVTTGSLRAYAKHRKEKGLIGGTLAAVQKAIAAHRITKGSDGKIDFERADREWEENLNWHKATTKRGHEFVTEPPVGDLNTVSMGEVPTENFLEAQRVHEWLKVQKEELTLKERRGELLEKSELQEAIGERLIAMRNKASALPANLAQKIALESDPITVEEILKSEIDAMLLEFSEWRPNAV